MYYKVIDLILDFFLIIRFINITWLFFQNKVRIIKTTLKMSLKKEQGLRINDQVILEEDFDENYQPTEEGQYFCIMIILILFEIVNYTNTCELSLVVTYVDIVYPK